MQIETLKVFCDVIETKSFSMAAEKSGITQSAVSQKISALEKEFGVVLLERGKKSFSMTPEGKVFLSACQDILKTYGKMGERFQELQHRVAGKLRLATVYSVGLHELPPYLKEFRSLFPEVDLEVTYRRASHIYTDVCEGRADLGFVAYPQERRGFVIDAHWRDKMVLICSPRHALACECMVSLSDLNGKNFISFEPDMPTRNAIDRLLKEDGVSVRESMAFDNVDTVKRAVEVQDAVSLVPLKTVADEVKAKTLCAIEVDCDEMWRPLGIIRKRCRALSPAMREFIELLNGYDVL